MNTLDQWMMNHPRVMRLALVFLLSLVILAMLGLAAWIGQGVWATSGPSGYFPDHFSLVTGEILASFFAVIGVSLAVVTVRSYRDL